MSITTEPQAGLIRTRCRWLLTRLAVALIAALAIMLGVGTVPAHAVTVQSGVNLRACVDLSNRVCANPVGTTSGGALKTRCWRDGSWANGNYQSNRWFLVVLKDGREGYVHASFVTNQQRVPYCRDLSYVRAADFAIATVGQVYATATVAADYTRADWGNPYGEWSGDCAKLAASSFSRGAGVGFERGNAIDMYTRYRNRGLIEGGIPRYGEPVFYDIARPWGHVAIYIGGTTVVSTQGLDTDRQPIAVRGLDSFANRLGWAVV